MDRNIAQDAASPKKRERFVLKYHNNAFWCVVATEKLEVVGC